MYEGIVNDDAGRHIPRSLDDLCDPSTLALVVYDMQVGVLGQLPDADAIVARVVEVLQAARAGGYPIFFLRHMFLPNRLKGMFGLRMAMAWQRVDSPAQLQEFLLRDSPEFALVPEMRPRADEAILDKTTMSAFEGTPPRAGAARPGDEGVRHRRDCLGGGYRAHRSARLGSWAHSGGGVRRLRRS